MSQKCLECDSPVKGRADKKFCSVECRSTYNNRLNRDINNFMRQISNILRKNRRILAELNPTGKIKVHRDKLLEKGFKFNYFTNIYRTQKGNTYHYCFDQGYLELDNDYYVLVIRKKFVE